MDVNLHLAALENADIHAAYLLEARYLGDDPLRHGLRRQRSSRGPTLPVPRPL